MSAVKVAAAAALVAVGICAHTTSSLRVLQASEFRRAFSLAAGMMAVITGDPATITAPQWHDPQQIVHPRPVRLSSAADG